MSSKVLFLLSHPDDEAYGPYGTMCRMVKEGKEVSVYSLCNGARPGYEDVRQKRVDTFIKNVSKIGARWKIWDKNDLTLDIKETSEFVSKLILEEQFDTVYTHNISDINRDHRITAEAALVGCRPRKDSTVDQLYFFEIPSSTSWSFNKLQPTFEPTVYNEISEEIFNMKIDALKLYETETYSFPDARSVEAMIALARYRGFQVGYNFAEAFQLVFQKL